MYYLYLILLVSFLSLDAKPATTSTPSKKTTVKKSFTTTVTANNFDAIVMKSKTPLLLDVYADWCGPCRRMAPVFEEVADKFKGKKITFAKMKMESFEESDKHIQLLKKKLDVSISMIPTMLYIKDGKVVETIVGSQSAANLNTKLTNLMKPTKTNKN